MAKKLPIRNKKRRKSKLIRRLLKRRLKTPDTGAEALKKDASGGAFVREANGTWMQDEPRQRSGGPC